MRLLFITPNLPAIASSGSAIIAYHYIKQLSERHAVDLISFTHKNNTILGDLAHWCKRVQLFYRPTRWQAYLKMLWGVMADVPLPVSHYAFSSGAGAIRRTIEQGAYDVVVFQLTEMAQFRPPRYHGATILSMENPLVLHYERTAVWYPSPANRLWRAYEKGRLRRYEQRHATHFSRVLLLNETDVTDYQRVLHGVNFDWVPYGIDTDFFKPATEQRQPGMIVITGNMNHRPNVEAINYFCGEIFPQVRQHFPAATLWLVGANPAPDVQKWVDGKNIISTGFVPDMRVYLRQAMVSICAVRLNVGSQTKVLEAMACGTPVVSTPEGNHGIAGISGEHLYVGHSAGEFAEYVVALLEGRNWGRLSQNARRFVLKNYAWDKVVVRLEAILNTVRSEYPSVS